MNLLLWLLLAFLCWPLALVALLLWPIVWLIGIPLRLVGISVRAALSLLEAAIRLPSRLAKGPG
ncbi:MAG: hypothetical protein MUP76_09635 [Acidimicrobiia bacterium]|nr:hypothetical protein [Acidimicrobiia bacterium]